MAENESKRKILVGRKLRPVTFTIDKNSVHDFSRLVNETNAVYFDPKAAALAGYPTCVVPPSYTQLVALAMIRSLDWKADLMLDWNTQTAMYGEQDLEYFRPLFYAEKLTVNAQISGVEHKAGKRTFDAVAIAIQVQDESGDLAMAGGIQLLLFD